jgi:WD40 repeat protein
MPENLAKVNTEGDVLGVAGDNKGTVNIYISQTSSDAEIQARELIKASPYLGLEKFEVEDHDKFFGRDRWIENLTEHLKQKNVLLLLGASGSGKSSLIQAGLVPALKKQPSLSLFKLFSFVPDVSPFESFYVSLQPTYKSKAKLAQIVKEDTLIQVGQSLKQDAQWLIFIDQFEELFTRTPKTERDVFIKSLIKLIEKSDSSIKVILTMRADFLDKLSPYPDLGKLHDRYSLMLTDMDDRDLRLAIAEPAARNGVVFEKGLIEQIIADFKQQAGSLPLLQYTLNLLWNKDDLQDRGLNAGTYQKLGGVTGALQQQANRIYDRFNEQQRKVAEQIFLELIELVGKEAVSRRADKAIFEGDAIQKDVLYQLIDHRLLVSKREGSKATVEVAHEELLRSWKVLQDLIREKEEIIVLRNRLYADAKQWHELGQKDLQKDNSELWNGSKLARIVELQREGSLPNLDAVAIEFIESSVTQAERQKNEKIRTARRIAVGSLVAVVISAGLGLIAWQKTREAELNLADALGATSLSLLDKGKDLDASVTAIKAGKILQSQRVSRPEVTNALQEALNKRSEYNRLEGHNDSVRSVSFSPDGKTLASGSADKTIKLWDLETGKEIRTLKGHDNYVNTISFSPDGKTLASGSGDKTIKLWNLETGKEIRTLKGHDNYVYSVSFSPDGKILASGSSDKTIKLWNLETGLEIRTLKGHDNYVRSVSFSPDGNTLASGSADKTIKLWNLETGTEISTLKGHDNYVYSVSFSPDSKTLASGSEDKTIKLWNPETGKEVSTLKGHDNAVNSVSFSHDSKTLASGSGDKTIKLWNLEAGTEISTLKGHDNAVRSVSFSPDGKILVSGSQDKTIKLWNLEAGTEISTLQGHDNPVYSVTFSPDSKILASGSADKTIKLWNPETGKEISTVKEHNNTVWSVSFSPDGKILASGSEDNTIKLWNVERGTEIRTLKGHDKVKSISFSPDGKILASGSEDNTIKLWNVERGTEIRTLKGHNGSLWRVSFSPDGKILASGSVDNTIKLWNPNTGTEIHTLKGHNNIVWIISFSPDGKKLVSSSADNTIKLWNVETGKEIRTLKGHDNSVYSVSFSPDGKTLVSGSSDNTIKLWNVETGKEIRTLKGHNNTVYIVSFSPDGKTLASGSGDKTIKLWNLGTDWDLDVLMGRSCDRVRAYLTYNINVSESDRYLCDGIGTQK